MAMTLLEAAKLEQQDALRSGIIEYYAGSSSLLGALPFQDIQGNALRYNTLDTLPGVAFRGVNEAYTESTGIINPQTESLVIAGGDLDVDKFILQTMGQDSRQTHLESKVRSLSLNWTSKFFKGDHGTDPREFDGMQNRVTGDQKIAAGSTSGGDALSLFKLDQLIDQVLNPTHLVMNKTMRLRLTQASRNTSVGGFVQMSQDAMGRQVAFYNGLPILEVDLDNAGTAILPFTEANPGGGSAASCSIYCLSMGGDGVVGLQNGGIQVSDLGELDTKPVFRTRVEWYSSYAIFNGRAAARLHGVKDAAVVV